MVLFASSDGHSLGFRASDVCEAGSERKTLKEGDVSYICGYSFVCVFPCARACLCSWSMLEIETIKLRQMCFGVDNDPDEDEVGGQMAGHGLLLAQEDI